MKMEYIADMWSLVITGQKQGFFFFISWYVFVLLKLLGIFQCKTSPWPGTEGVLLKADLKKWGANEWGTSNQDYSTEALYTYRVNHKTYEGTRVSPWIMIVSHNAQSILKNQLKGIQENPDGTVKIYFNPAKPQQSYLIQWGAWN